MKNCRTCWREAPNGDRCDTCTKGDGLNAPMKPWDGCHPPPEPKDETMTDPKSIHAWLQTRCERIAKNPPSARWDLSVETRAIADFLTEVLGGAMPKAKCDCPKCKGTGVVWEGIQSFACIGCQGRSCGHYPHTECIDVPLGPEHGDPDPSVIHVAEGVTLEPGEYEDNASGVRINLAGPWKAKLIDGNWAFTAYLQREGQALVTAVRRVDPKPASEPVAPAAADERPIVVGSTWLETERNLISTVLRLGELSPGKPAVRVTRMVDGRKTEMWFGLSVFYRLFTWVSDPAPPQQPAKNSRTCEDCGRVVPVGGSLCRDCDRMSYGKY